jgi:ParB family chromosome partitioning protein
MRGRCWRSTSARGKSSCRLSVRQLEALVGVLVPARKRRARRADPELTALEDALRQALGTKVNVISRKKGGRIVVEYFSAEDLTRILQILGVSV